MRIQRVALTSLTLLAVEKAAAFVSPALQQANLQSMASQGLAISPLAPPTATTSGPVSSLPVLSRSTTTTTLQMTGLEDISQSLFAYEGPIPLELAFALNAVLFALLSPKLLKSLTPEGFAHSLALGTLLWATLGWRGWSLCVLYLFAGNVVTRVKFEEKEARGLAEGRGGRRGPENVWGSALTAVLCGSAAVQPADSWVHLSGEFPTEIFVIGYVASLATKLSDTFASEIGKAYGKTTFLITTFERVEPGTEGAVSLEGTVASVGGGLLLSVYGLAVGLISAPAVAVSTFAAFVATNVESVLGATLQEKEGLEWVSNEVINGINTLVGASIAIAMAKAVLEM